MTDRVLLEHAREGRLMHALLVTGPNVSGRLELAKNVASMFCMGTETPEKLAECPNYIEISPNEKGVIRTEPIREMNKQAALSSFSGNKRAFLIRDAHLMNENAQNALLKTLEEAPERTMMILEGAEEALLPTICSRCAIWRVGSEPTEKLTEQLTVEGFPMKTAAYAARKSDGIGQKARFFCSDGYGVFAADAGKLLDTVLFGPKNGCSSMRRILETDYFPETPEEKKSKKKGNKSGEPDESEEGNTGKKILAKRNALLLYEYFEAEFRDALLIKEGAFDLCPDASDRAKRIAAHLTERGLISVADVLQDAYKRHRLDTDQVRTMDWLLLELQRTERENV